MNKKKEQPEKKPRQHKTEEHSLKVPYWLARKAKAEGLSLERLFTYCWLYTKNYYANSHHGGIFGKRTYTDLWNNINADLGFGDAGDLCRALESHGWIQKAVAGEFNGIRQVGYLCLLSPDQRLEARAAQQEATLPDEEAVVEVESSVPAPLEYVYGGIRFYDDDEGTPHQVPSSAPPRPTPTAVWLNDPEGWYEPDSLPTNDPSEPLPF